ncbi:glutathione peroxidase (plasmid) [Paracoccus sp. TK19116]|uniref:Glutathione peroxidase n=1 Tax=Paracoccus albicereus TaxID=2922394 RepID=A0ABT1MPA7_9RHOB|nr:glutathione peroxidase [Paracoccus albicereus]MCQ0969381.1 glutathione peroxidase [Paracoccus albicereus]
MKRRVFTALMMALGSAITLRRPRIAEAAGPAPTFTFPGIDGSTIDSAEWRGKPALVVNTASLCGFTPQLEDMQALYESHAPKGLVVVAVPSDDFAQELDDAKKVKEFCTLQYGITLPMTDILHVKGKDAHPFYAWVKEQSGFQPGWNFNKILLGPDGNIVATWGSMTKPGSDAILSKVEPLLPRS